MFAPSSIKSSLDRWWPTVGALAWIVVIAGLTVVPAITGGRSMGPFNTLYQSGLTSIPGYHANNFITGDNITQGVPWSAYNWVAVHHGQLPLWNRFNGLGLPQAFNFLSGSFAPTSMVSYLAPLRYAFATLEFAKLVVAGTGVLLLGRVLRLSVVSALFAATVFELSGALTGWLAWPQSGSVAWLGWVLALVILVAENRRGVAAVVLLAVVVAANALEGHPETLALDLACAAFVGVVIGCTDVRGSAHVIATAARRVGRVALGMLAGLALSAPLLWPGITVLENGVRHGNVHYSGFALINLSNVLAAGYFGYPVAGSTFFGTNNYYETAMWVGVITVVLALAALIAPWRRRYVTVFAAIAAVCLVVLFFHPLAMFLSSHALTNAVQWWHLTFLLTVALAVLAGFGVDNIVHRWRSTRQLGAFVAATALVGGAVAFLWLRRGSQHLTPLASSLQRTALRWPSIGLITCVACALVLAVTSYVARSHPSIRPTRRIAFGVVTVLFVVETLTLFTATPQLWSSSTKFFQATPAIRTLQRTVGDERVGLGACVRLTAQPVNLGIRVESNIMYGISEFAAYDPLIPTSLFNAWYRASGAPAPGAFVGSVFCPSVTTRALARHFGVRYVIEPASASTPAGFVFVQRLGDEQLDLVPGTGVVTTESPTDAPDGPAATPVRVHWTTNSSMTLATSAERATVLYVHEQAAKGWHVAIDGRPAPFSVYDHTMMLVNVPAGRHEVSLTYRPASFVKGLALALITAVALLVWLLVDHRRRGRPGTTTSEESFELTA